MCSPSTPGELGQHLDHMPGAHVGAEIALHGALAVRLRLHHERRDLGAAVGDRVHVGGGAADVDDDEVPDLGGEPLGGIDVPAGAGLLARSEGQAVAATSRTASSATSTASTTTATSTGASAASDSSTSASGASTETQTASAGAACRCVSRWRSR